MILVVGGTGTVGRLVLESIAAADFETRALVRDLDKARALKLATVQFVQGDLADAASIAPALEGIEKIVLISSFSQEMARLQTNLVEAAARASGRPRIVKLSGAGAAPDGPTTMARWHGAIEDSGLPWTFLRPVYFMQNLLMMSGGIRKSGAFALPAAGAAVAQIDARDVAAVIVRVVVEAGHEGKAYDLTGPDAITWVEVAEILSAVADRPIRYDPVTPEEFKRRLESAGMPAWLVDALNEMFAQFRAGAGMRTTDHVRRITNQPPRSFAVFARDHAHAFRAD
ncbi:MAG: azoreductase [Rhodospirillales bacterium]|nr:azoreductase [Rhodospirillales bacterium]